MRGSGYYEITKSYKYPFQMLTRHWRCGIHLHSASNRSSNSRSTQGKDGIISHVENLSYPRESLYNFLTKNFKRFSENLALVDGITSQSLDYKTLLARVRSFGTVLKSNGFHKGDVLGFLSQNCPQYPVVTTGTHGCKGVVTTINPSYTVNEIVYQLKDSGATFLVAGESVLDKAVQAADIVGVRKLIVIGGYGGNNKDIITWDEIQNEDGSSFPHEVEVDPEQDIVFMPYSSGTTGKPKGVMLTHKNIISNILQIHFLSLPIENCSVLGLLPFFHIYGLIVVLLHNLWQGNTVVTLPNFQQDTFLKTIEAYKVDKVNVVPPILQFLLKNPLANDYDLSCMRELTTGAAPCAQNLHEAISKKLVPTYVRQGYGLTETSPVLLIQPFENIKAGATGIPLPDTEVKVVDLETGHPLEANLIGEVWARGPQVMLGYLNRPAETSDCLTADRWFRTGDLGYYDDDHHFYIVDRVKELIKYKGFQVPPAELEDMLLSHPKVSDAAVIGLPDEECGELPKAFVVTKGEVSERELLSFVESQVAPHKKLRGGLEIVDSIPRAPSGKILRRKLREIACKVDS